MLCECHLRRGIVYIPTMGKVEWGGGYRGVEPVAVVSVGDAEALRHAIRAAVVRGNPIVPQVTRANHPEPVVLKYAGVKTWSAFACGTLNWSIQEKDGVYEIVGYRDGRYGGWEQDPEQRTRFPAGTPLDTVIERAIAILQSAARA